jgi:hypothetical protein
MFRPRPVVNEDIIKEYEDEAAEERPEDVVQKGLEGGWCIRQAERHDQELKESLVCSKRHLGNVIIVHQYLVVDEAQVDFLEEACALAFI